MKVFAATWTHAPQGAAAWRRAIALYAVYAGAVVALLWPSAATMAEQWVSSSSFHHAPFAAPLALWLILRDRRAASAPRPAPAALAAVAFIASAWLAGRALGANIIEHAALVGLLVAGVVLIFGARNARRWCFALAALFFLVPFGVSLAPVLQYIAATASAALLSVAGFAPVRDGLVIATSGGAFEVAPSCSGLNFLLVSLMTSLAFAHAALDGWRRRLLFIALAAAMAVAANVLRVTLVIAAATLAGPGSPLAADHIAFGWVLYAALLAVLIAAGRRLARDARQARA